MLYISNVIIIKPKLFSNNPSEIGIGNVAHNGNVSGLIIDNPSQKVAHIAKTIFNNPSNLSTSFFSYLGSQER